MCAVLCTFVTPVSFMSPRFPAYANRHNAAGHPEFDAYLQEWMAKQNGPLLGMAATSPVHGSRYLVSPAVSALKGQFDGPGSTPSQTGSPRPSPRLSSGSPAGRQNPYAPPSAGPLVNIPNTRVELPSAAYALVNGVSGYRFPFLLSNIINLQSSHHILKCLKF